MDCFKPNWPDIEEHLDSVMQTAQIALKLNEASVSGAVKKFIQHKVHQLANVKNYKGRVCDLIYHHVLENSQGTFLWEAVVCRGLDGTSSKLVFKKLKEFPPGLDTLYSRMHDQVLKSGDAGLCKNISI